MNAVVILFTTELPNRITDALEAQGLEVFEALAISKVLALAEQHPAFSLLITPDVDQETGGCRSSSNLRCGCLNRMLEQGSSAAVCDTRWRYFIQREGFANPPIGLRERRAQVSYPKAIDSGGFRFYTVSIYPDPIRI